MIRCLVVDDHAAVRAGLLAVLRSEPGFVPVGSGDTAAAALEGVIRYVPDLVLVDYNLPDCDGLLLCCDLKTLPDAPQVVLYSAFAGPQLALAATVAGADALVGKGEPVEEMLHVLRMAARGPIELAPPLAGFAERWRDELDPSEIAIFGMAIARTPVDEIAAVTRETLETVRGRIRAIVSRLAPEHPETV